MPWRIWAPSNAGPAGAEHAHRRSREPSSTSPLVPMSTAMRSCGALVDAGGERHRHRVGADEAGHEGQQAHARLGRDLEEELARGERQRRGASPARRARGRRTRDRCRAACGACTCCRRPRPCRSTWRARPTRGTICSTCWLSRPTMRVCSLRRLPGLNCAKAMRDMRSPPKTACGFRLDTDASCSPELELHQGGHHAGGADVDGEAELAWSAVSPALDGEDAAGRSVVTVTPAGSSRSACGRPASTPGGTSAAATPDRGGELPRGRRSGDAPRAAARP